MNVVVFGTDSVNGFAVNSIVRNILSFLCKKEKDINVFAFGYGKEDAVIRASHNCVFYEIKNPFATSRINKYRIKRRINSLFRNDGCFVDLNYFLSRVRYYLSNIVVDCVISSSGIFMYTEAAYCFSIEKKAKLILLYFDPYTNNISTINKHKRELIERKWIERAEKVYYDADGEKPPFLDFKHKYIPFLIPIFPKDIHKAENNKKTIAYGGSFYKEFRSTSCLFAFLAKNSSRKDVTFKIYSNIKKPDYCYDNVVFNEVVSKDEFERVCNSSFALIVIGNGNYSKTIPSKILEAISYKKPIIGLNFNSGGETLLNRYPLYFDGESNDVIDKVINAKLNFDIDLLKIYPERDPCILIDSLIESIFC